MPKTLIALALLAVVATALQTETGTVKVDNGGPESWEAIASMFYDYATETEAKDIKDPHQLIRAFAQNIVSKVPKSLLENRPPRKIRDGGPLPGPYFGFIPDYETSIIPAAPDAKWSAPCWGTNSASVTVTESAASITISNSNASGLFCSDWYLLGSVIGVKVTTLSSAGSTVINWPFKSNLTESEFADIKANGFRVFRFLDSFINILADLYDTAQLFLPAMQPGKPIPDSCQQANLQFLQEYADITFEARNASTIPLNYSIIQSGDFFGVMRLDGLDPMLAWAMGGSHTGHNTVALWIDGVLHVCESTTKDAYWPTNGIQCTEFEQWMSQAETAMFNVVWLPLSDEKRAIFNETAAVEFVKANLGLDYGFGNILFGWLDTESDNYPFPLTAELHQLLPAWANNVAPYIADLLWMRALNLRMGTTGLNPADLYYQMMQRGLTFGQLAAMPEQDSWLYTQVNNNNQTVQGRSMVCCVFVCSVWKAAGLMEGADVQCGEATNWDVYTSNFFKQNYVPPAVCQAADPDLPFCQLTGNWRVQLPQWNSRPVGNHAFENCPRGSPPSWDKPVGC